MMHILDKAKSHKQFLIYFFVIALGIVTGLADIGILQTAGAVIADLFIKLFKLISLPIISLSIIVTVATLAGEESSKKLWQRTLIYTLSTTLIAATVSCIMYLIIQPKNFIMAASHTNLAVDKQMNYTQFIANLLPTNIFAPFIEHQVMGVLLLSIAVGIAIRYIPEDDAKDAAINFFRGLHGIFLVITKWVITILPIGLFGFITTTFVQLKEGVDISGIGEYLLIIVGANLIQGFVVLPLWLSYNKIKPFHTMHKMLPALSIAFFSKSSAGTLPVTMNTAEKRLGIDPKVSRFVLPLCTTINMNGCAAFIFATVIFLMQNQGIPITLSMMAIWILIATIAAVGNAGVPMGCFFLSASLLTSMNVPIELLGIILPFYTVIDMVETSLNVWSDSCVVAVVNERALMDETTHPIFNHEIVS